MPIYDLFHALRMQNLLLLKGWSYHSYAPENNSCQHFHGKNGYNHYTQSHVSSITTAGILDSDVTLHVLSKFRLAVHFTNEVRWGLLDTITQNNIYQKAPWNLQCKNFHSVTSIGNKGKLLDRVRHMCIAIIVEKS